MPGQPLIGKEINEVLLDLRLKVQRYLSDEHRLQLSRNLRDSPGL